MNNFDDVPRDRRFTKVKRAVRRQRALEEQPTRPMPRQKRQRKVSYGCVGGSLILLILALIKQVLQHALHPESHVIHSSSASGTVNLFMAVMLHKNWPPCGHCLLPRPSTSGKMSRISPILSKPNLACSRCKAIHEDPGRIFSSGFAFTFQPGKTRESRFSDPSLEAGLAANSRVQQANERYSSSRPLSLADIKDDMKLSQRLITTHSRNE
jgi:hypothetical protein